MTKESLITDEALSMIGVESQPVTGYEVTEHEIRRYAYAVDDLNQLWADPDYARKSSNGGIVAPPLFHIIPFANDRPLSELREDGIPQGTTSGRVTPPLKATRTMAGGTEVEFFAPIRPGDVLTSVSRLVDLYEREGRSGRLGFSVTETTYSNQHGEMVAAVKSTLIVR